MNGTNTSIRHTFPLSSERQVIQQVLEQQQQPPKKPNKRPKQKKHCFRANAGTGKLKCISKQFSTFIIVTITQPVIQLALIRSRNSICVPALRDLSLLEIRWEMWSVDRHPQ